MRRSSVILPLFKAGNVAAASEVYNTQINDTLIPFLNNIELPKSVEEPIDFVEVSNFEDTKFGMQPISNIDETMYHIPVEEVKESMDNVLTPEETFTNDTEHTTIIDFGVEEKEEEVEEIEQPKVLKKHKKAGYIDTVILCLVAQLGIFGLLIIVLLVIK